MSVYVDELRELPPGAPSPISCRTWAHLASDADDLTELHEFAQRLGLKRAWFQDKFALPHYDLVPSRHALALRLGATLVTTRELWLRCGRGPLAERLRREEVTP